MNVHISLSICVPDFEVTIKMMMMIMLNTR